MDEQEASRALRLEAHLARSWPTLDTMRIAGFELRFGGGYGRRSNSARRLRVTDGSLAWRSDSAPPEPDAVSGIEVVEALYRERGSAPTFYVADAFGDLALERALVARGYTASEDFHVLARALEAPPASAPIASWPRVTPGAAAEAAATLAMLGGAKGADATGLAALLEHAELGMRLAIDFARGAGSSPVAACLGFVEGELGSVHELVTLAEARREGRARALLLRMLSEASRAGVRCMTAQVAATNVASLGLFDSLGFERVFRYRYLVGPIRG